MNIYHIIIKAAKDAMAQAAHDKKIREEWDRMVQSGVINVREFNKKYLTKG